MVPWKPRRAGVAAEVVEPERVRVADQHAEDAPSARQVTDRSVRLGVDTGGEEALEPRAARIEHAERRVARTGERGGGLDELLEDGLERQLRGKGDPGRDERP